jgi:crotonobetainyl-CoA:carnitine CoA-transferase CaiB-like acyl-CoA transferase
MVLPLEGLKVLDLTSYAPGPYCTMILGDFGADVVSIGQPVISPSGQQDKSADRPGGAVRPQETPPPDSPYNPVSRNKRSIKINLKDDIGKQVLFRLAEKADVVVEGFRPGVAKRLGIDYETLKKKNERLIYCSITGYGQDGPYRDLVGHDINYLSFGGAANILNYREGLPPPDGNLVGDMAAGGMQATIGILLALAAREKTGKGQFIDISITDGIVSLLSMCLGGYLQSGKVIEQDDRLEFTPYYGFYQTMDGKYISIGCMEPKFFAGLCQIMECTYFIPFQTDKEKTKEIRSYLQKKFRTKTRDEWFEILSQKDIPAGKVYSLDEVASDAQMISRGMITEIDHPEEGKIKQVGISIKLSDTPGKIRSLPVKKNNQNLAILVEAGFTLEDIRALEIKGVIQF